MWSFKDKLPMGLAALCVVSLFGLKDTGVFINEHVQRTYSDNEIEFSIGEKVNIVEKKNDSYIVTKGKAKVTIPQDKILLTEVDIPTYRITKATPIKREGQILRNLFVGEYAVFVEDKGDVITVKCNDGTIGDVDKSSLDKIADQREHETKVEIIEDTVVRNNSGKLSLKSGQMVNVVNFNNGNFVIKDENEQKYSISGDKLSIRFGEKLEKPVEREIVRIASLEQDEKEIEKIALQASKINRSNNGTAQQILSSAASKLGSTYVYGATGDGGYDCSGLVYAVYKNEMGINLPRTSSAQSGFGEQVQKSNLQEGDLVFFNTTGSGVSHVGIYIGNDQFIHASSGQGKVITSSLSEDYYSKRYVNATRVL